MKLLTILLALITVALAIPTQATPQHLARDDVDCSWCSGMYDFCVKNGHSKGQEGCMQTCRDHVCHRHAECKGCGEPFDRCPEESRFHN